MEKESIKNIFPLDRQENGTDHRSLQRSVEKVVEHENHEWQTLRVQEDTKIKVEWLSIRCFFDIVGQVRVGDSNIEKFWVWF